MSYESGTISSSRGPDRTSHVSRYLHHAIENTANQITGKLLYVRQYYIQPSHHVPRVCHIDCVDQCIFCNVQHYLNFVNTVRMLCGPKIALLVAIMNDDDDFQISVVTDIVLIHWAWVIACLVQLYRFKRQ